MSAKEQYHTERLHALAPASPHIKPIKIMRIKTLTIFMHSHFCIYVSDLGVSLLSALVDPTITAIRLQLHSVRSFRVFRFHSEIRVEAQFYCLTYLCWAIYSDVGIANMLVCIMHSHIYAIAAENRTDIAIQIFVSVLALVWMCLIQTPFSEGSPDGFTIHQTTVNWRLIHFVQYMNAWGATEKAVWISISSFIESCTINFCVFIFPFFGWELCRQKASSFRARCGDI